MKIERVRPSRVWTDPRLLAWTALTLLASPLLLIAKLKRHFVQGYEWEFCPARWHVPDLSPDVPTAQVMFVGAGPGELAMIDRLVDALEARRPDLTIGICLRNLDALKRLREERPGRRLALWPFDALPPVARWLRQERPEIVVFVDRFRFPAFVGGTASSGGRLALVNGRGRRRRGFFYRLAAPFYHWQFGGFALMAMQSEAAADAARDFANPSCRVLAPGSLKADLRRRESSREVSASLKAWAGEGPLVAVGSTADPEEEGLVLDAFLTVRKQAPCRLLLAPRDVRRLDSTLALLRDRGLSVGRRSEGSLGDVLLLDTFGELATAYGLARAAYVGGFRGKGGGHNVLEPLEHAVPVAYGPNSGHFEAERRLIEVTGVGTPVRDAAGLAAFWIKFLRDDDVRTQIGALGQSVLEANRGAVERTAAALIEALS